jgi:hypothetical protein
LVIVAIDHAGTEVDALLQHANPTIVTETECGDIEQAYEEALAQSPQPSRSGPAAASC